MSITGWLLERLATQNANKVLERFGFDKISIKIFPTFKPKTAPVKSFIETYSFLDNIFHTDQGLSILGMRVEADDTISVRRVTVLYNREGGNGSYELAAFAPPREMHRGEHFRLPLLHWRYSVGTFWGDVSHVTEQLTLDRLSAEERSDHGRRILLSTGSYYCEVVVLHDKGEARLRFTVQSPAGRGKPGIVCPSDHRDYDANRLIPARSGFWL